MTPYITNKEMVGLQVGDIVQRASSIYEVVGIDNEADGDYARLEIKCLESNDDFISVGEIEEVFLEKCSFVRKGNR